MIKKSVVVPTGAIKKQPVPSTALKFSFKLFDAYDVEMCPATFKDGYVQKLMQRLKDLSDWKVLEFTNNQHKSVRNHPHDWAKTARPRGFAHLNDHYRSYEGWQFCLSANEYGRVHGIIIDDTFYVIWLDQDHRMYQKGN